MRFLPLGVGDAFTALHYTHCVAVESQGRYLLIDCPHPIRKMLREGGLSAGLPLDVDQVDGVVLTHLHADHASGLEGLGYFFHFALKKRLPLLLHPDVERRLWEGHLAAGMECLLPAVGQPYVEKRLSDYFEIHHLDEGAKVRFGGFDVECRTTIHHIPTTALKLHADGKTLGLSSDTAFDPSLIEWLSAADLFIHETNFGVHTPYEKLAGLPAPVRAKMRLIHYPDSFDLEGSTIEPLRQGKLYEV